MSLNVSAQRANPVGVAPTGAYAFAYRRQMYSGANWFYWIAALSLVNSVVSLSNGGWSFLAGLGITQIFDGVAHGLSGQLGGGASAVALVLDLVVAGCFVGLGLLARKGMRWAFVVGMVAYALDGALLALLQVWLSFAFHAFALYSVYRGFVAAGKLAELEAKSAPGV